MSDLPARLRAIRLVAMDVDGVLTDGGIYWGVDSGGVVHESKQFHARDGLGISLLRAAGLTVAWITGRQSAVVERRAAELRVDVIRQWARNKRVALGEVAADLKLTPPQVLYIGDDLNDLPAFEVAGVRVAVADAVAEVRAAADWVTQERGGQGAVREVADQLLKAQDAWDAAVVRFLDGLAAEHSRPGPSGQ